jgi:hypothetical protein
MHRKVMLFTCPMVLLNPVIKVLIGAVLHLPYQDTADRRLLVTRYTFWLVPASPDSLFEKRLGRS